MRIALSLLAALALAGCGAQLAPAPTTDHDLALLRHAAFPVYWLSRSFQGNQVTGAGRDPGGAANVAYGVCASGGQSTCVHPVLVVTAPDNSFVPGAVRHGRAVTVRGRRAIVGEGGRTIEIPTGPVVVDVLATTPRLARAAARALRPLQADSTRAGGALPPPSGPSGFARSPSD